MPDQLQSDARLAALTNLCKASADHLRLLILRVLRNDSFGVSELCAIFDTRQPALSHHLKVLHDAGLVDRDKRGVWVYYKARTEAMDALRTLFSGDLAAPQLA